MKNYTITVNGNVYNVTVEEGTTAGVVQNAAPVAAAPVAAAPVAAAPAAPKAPAKKAATAGAGSIKVNAGTQGKVVKINAPVGTDVKAGDAVVSIEAMKMEILVAAPEDGTVASVDCAVGDSINPGQTLATLN